ncbi:MAG: class I SAM-dependent methyltransferase [Bacteroidales bacterium]|nr:class I SAM-dependent methyltransferase [Bacteroidales bacterium]
MTVDVFFELFLEELKESPELHKYYKFLQGKKSFGFRKAYFSQRLQYISDNIQDKSSVIWDCGCGYGTTALYLAMNGYRVKGSTLEFYYEQIEKRKAWWSRHGDTSLFEVSYENIFDSHPESATIDIIILQDTLHHLEPVGEAIYILHKVLKPGGYIILIEENGNNIIQNAKLLIHRGNKRVIELYDEKLKKTFLLGNENIRGLKKWEKIFGQEGLQVDDALIKYIRILPPFSFKGNVNENIAREQKIIDRNRLLKKRFAFGLNMIVRKPL